MLVNQEPKGTFCACGCGEIVKVSLDRGYKPGHSARQFIQERDNDIEILRIAGVSEERIAEARAIGCLHSFAQEFVK